MRYYLHGLDFLSSLITSCVHSFLSPVLFLDAVVIHCQCELYCDGFTDLQNILKCFMCEFGKRLYGMFVFDLVQFHCDRALRQTTLDWYCKMLYLLKRERERERERERIFTVVHTSQCFILLYVSLAILQSCGADAGNQEADSSLLPYTEGG